MNSEVLDGGQGRNRTTDTRIFREDNGLHVRLWGAMDQESGRCYLYRVSNASNGWSLSAYDPALATAPIDAAT
jgi:hypothetical protein